MGDMRHEIVGEYNAVDSPGRKSAKASLTFKFQNTVDVISSLPNPSVSSSFSHEIEQKEVARLELSTMKNFRFSTYPYIESLTFSPFSRSVSTNFFSFSVTDDEDSIGSGASNLVCSFAVAQLFMLWFLLF